MTAKNEVLRTHRAAENIITEITPPFREIQKLTKELLSLNGQILGYQETIAVLRRSNSAYQQDISSLKSQIAELKKSDDRQRAIEMHNEFTKSQSELSQMKTKYGTALEKIKRLETILEMTMDSPAQRAG